MTANRSSTPGVPGPPGWTEPELVTVRKDEWEALKRKVSDQARQLHIKDDALHEKNLLLDAMHMVWCDGACYRGVHRYEDRPVTEELVALAERNTARLRKWFNGVRWRQTSGNYLTTSEYHRRYLERITAKVPLDSDESEVRSE